MPTSPPFDLLKPGRPIEGISALLLPLLADGSIDWESFDRHVRRTRDVGLTPAVNMDTGYVHLLSPAQRLEVLDRTRQVLGGGPFVAGAFVKDSPGDAVALDAYRQVIDDIQSRGGTPVIFPSHGLTALPADALISAYESLARGCDRFIGFELGTMFAPFGAVYDLPTYERLMRIPQCIGAKHSSLSRTLEWDRLRLRNKVRPDFRVYTGNDLAIDMVMYGSDYLLGLSSFAPDLFARRDAYWSSGDERFFELNDLLQYLGFFAFRNPVPAYKHSAAQFLHLRGWTATDQTFPGSPTRPESDRDVLRDLARRLESLGASS